MMRLALPVFVEETLNLLVGYTDWWLAGRFVPGAEPQAAMGLMAYVLWLLPSLFAMLAIGSTALTARLIGARDGAGAGRVLHQALLLGTLFATLATVLAVLGGDRFIAGMQLRDEAAVLAGRYLRILTPIIPAIMIEQVCIACLRGAGDTLSGLGVKSLVNVINVIVSASLVTGAGGLPKLGWDGLAVGTACGHGVAALVLILVLSRGRAGLRLNLRDFTANPTLIARILRVGVPGGVDVWSILACHLTYFAIVGSLGSAQTAAHGLGIQIEALAYLPGTAFQVAAGTIAGQLLGAGQPERAKRGVLMTCLVGGAFMSAAGVVLYLGGGWLASFFTGGVASDTSRLTAELLCVVAFSMPSLAACMILAGALRGAGDTRWPLLVTFIGYLGVRLPGACWLAWDEIPVAALGIEIPGLGWGVAGAWCAMVLDVGVRSVLFTLRYAHGGWTRVKV